MYVFNDLVSYGGTRKPTAETTHAVSLWYLPGGYDAVNAQSVVAYFSSQADADRFAAHFANPPEMALAYPFQAASQVAEAVGQEGRA